MSNEYITSEGKSAVMEAVFVGGMLALGNMSEDGKSFTELSTSSSVNPGYSRMPIEECSNNASDQNTLYVEIEDGTVTNGRAAYFGDADDGETADSLEILSEGGWTEQASAIAVYRGNTLYYASKFTDDPVSVYQGHRIKIPAGKFKVTFNPVEVSDDGVQAASLDLESDITLETDNGTETG